MLETQLLMSPRKDPALSVPTNKGGISTNTDPEWWAIAAEKKKIKMLASLDRPSHHLTSTGWAPNVWCF